MNIDEILEELEAIKEYMSRKDAITGYGQICELIIQIKKSGYREAKVRGTLCLERNGDKT